MVIKILFGFLTVIAILFIPAGTWKWPEAWLFILIYLAWFSIAISKLKKHNPNVLKERSKFKLPKRSWDKIFVALYTITSITLFVIVGLDAVRYQWSHVPITIKSLAFLVIILWLISFYFVLRENAYLSKIVEVQEEEGHKVITTGPYKYVRHPMYIGYMVFLLFFPLAMGSYYGLIPAVATVIILTIRTHFEDKILHQELTGYTDYAQKTRYRLIPGIW